MKYNIKIKYNPIYNNKNLHLLFLLRALSNSFFTEAILMYLNCV